MRRPLRILFASPAYWPAVAFGGPIAVARDLTEGLAARGHEVDVVTTSILDLERGRSLRTRRAEVGGVRVHYLATPARYRWMGITPTLPLELARLRFDVAHVFGYRDPVGTGVTAWCRARGVPYLFEPLGMLPTRWRKTRLKRALDPLVMQPLVRGATLLVATSGVEREELLAAGADPERIAVRPNPFPPPRPGRTGVLRGELGLADEPLVLYVGRIARGKGIELVLEALAGLPDAHLALVGPDDRHGTVARVRAAQAAPATAGRVHLLGPRPRPLELYGDADVFVLASEGENFGLVAAEAAAAGTPVVVTDRAGVAELVDGRAGLVVPFDAGAIREATGRLLADAELRARLAAGALALAAELQPAEIVRRQEKLYLRALAR